jgi:hypothetical protein
VHVVSVRWSTDGSTHAVQLPPCAAIASHTSPGPSLAAPGVETHEKAKAPLLSGRRAQTRPSAAPPASSVVVSIGVVLSGM